MAAVSDSTQIDGSQRPRRRLGTERHSAHTGSDRHPAGIDSQQTGILPEVAAERHFAHIGSRKDLGEDRAQKAPATQPPHWSPRYLLSSGIHRSRYHCIVLYVHTETLVTRESSSKTLLMTLWQSLIDKSTPFMTGKASFTKGQGH